METISSMNNRWVKLAAQLKIRKYREKTDLFLVEGVRSVEDAFLQGRRDAVCFVTDRALAEPRIQSLTENAGQLHWLFLRVEEAMMERLSGTAHGQGVLAILKKEKTEFTQLLEKPGGHYVLLDSIQDPGNMGTILRTAAAAGCSGVLLTEGCTDPYSEKAVRSSMGSILRLPVFEGVTLDQLAELKGKSGLIFAGTTLEGGTPYKMADIPEDAVFIFGNEGSGIRPEILALCDEKIYIPMAGTVESLNVAACAAVILFHYKK